MDGSAAVKLTEGRRDAAWTPRRSWLSPLSLPRIRFHCKALTPLTFLAREQGYKGNAFHTRFEAGLARVSPPAHRLLCAHPDSSRKPYILSPPLDGLTQYPAAQHFEIELVLVGAAIRCATACHSALVQAGRDHGLGTMRGQFVVDAVECPAPGADETLAAAHSSNSKSRAVSPVTAGALMRTPANPVSALTLQFLTPLRLHNASRQVPTFHAIMRSLLRRAAALALHDPAVGPEDEAETAELLRCAKLIETTDSALTWFDWERASPFKDEWMKLGGYVGAMEFAGELKQFVPWLHLGAWIHVGGKTSFGLGKYQFANPVAVR